MTSGTETLGRMAPTWRVANGVTASTSLVIQLLVPKVDNDYSYVVQQDFIISYGGFNLKYKVIMNLTHRMNTYLQLHWFLYKSLYLFYVIIA